MEGDAVGFVKRVGGSMAIRIAAVLLAICGLSVLAYQGFTGSASKVGTACGSGGECAAATAREGNAVVSSAEGRVVRYEGETREGKRNGFGTGTWANGNTYTGDWRDDVPHGRGRFTVPDGGYHEGEWRNGKANGLGVAVWRNKSRYNGDWCDGKLEGRGTLILANGNRYEGEWRGTKMSGQGRGMWTDGSTYEGAWQQDWPHGPGTYRSKGATYTGTWTSGCLKADGEVIAVGKTRQQCTFLLETALVRSQ